MSDMGAVEARVKAAAENDDIGFRYAGSRTLLHWWLGEHEKRRLTKAERAVVLNGIRDGSMRYEHAVGAFGRGVVRPAP